MNREMASNAFKIGLFCTLCASASFCAGEFVFRNLMFPAYNGKVIKTWKDQSVDVSVFGNLKTTYFTHYYIDLNDDGIVDRWANSHSKKPTPPSEIKEGDMVHVNKNFLCTNTIVKKR